MENGYAICFNKWALDKEIKTELGLLLIISSLTAEKGFCWATNKYLADLFELTEVSVSNKIKKLEKKGYIIVEYEKRGCEVLNRRIRLKNILIDDLKKFEPTIKKNFKENNTINNNTNNNIYIYSEKKLKFGIYGRIKLTKKQYERLCEEFGKEFINNQINNLDEYVQSNNNKNKYSDFNLVLRKSIRENWFKNKPIKNIENKPVWYDKKIEEDTATEEEIKELERRMNSGKC